MDTHARSRILRGAIKRAALLFCVFFPVSWFFWIGRHFEQPERSIVLRYVASTGLFKVLALFAFLSRLPSAMVGEDMPPIIWTTFPVLGSTARWLEFYDYYLAGSISTAATWILLFSIFVSGLGVWLLSIFLGPPGTSDSRRLMRGGFVISWRSLSHQTRVPFLSLWREDERSRQLFIGPVAIPYNVEPRHILLVGSTGTGKSQILYQLTLQIIKRRDRAFVLDLNGALLSRFAVKGDKVLNPLDARTEHWNPFLDICARGDLQSLVMATIPTVSGDNEEWRGYARTIMQAVMARLQQTGMAQPRHVVYFATQAPTGELASLCEGTAAQRFFERGNEKLLSNSLPNFSQGVAPWIDLPDNGTFSMREWIRTGTGSLYVNVQERQFDLMRQLISSWIWLAITEALSLPESDTRRLWFLLDELASYNQLPKLDEALAKLRKYGGCVVAALQDVAQLDHLYEHDRARAIRNCFSTYVGLRCEDPETATYAARRVGGEQEVERDRTSRTSSYRTSSKTISTDNSARQAVLPSEISRLPDRHAYLKISGGYQVAKIKVPISKVVISNPPFVPIPPSIDSVFHTTSATA